MSEPNVQESITPYPGMVIRSSVTLAPGTYQFPDGNGLQIPASGITINGQGAQLVGPGSVDAGPDSYTGTGVFSEHTNDVTIVGLNISGFQRGLHLRHCRGWTVENNVLSRNYHDPAFGWGDGPAYGALLLEHVEQSSVRRNIGQQCWNGLDLRYSHHNVIEDNVFSHCSNVCLRMWNACHNLIADNDFSWGIRIDPGEVHARDSSSMLMESGSDDNVLRNNDFRFGGDGIFVRMLNGWASKGNLFEGNDCSHANNNAVESWSPGNTYLNNRANFSSYGFWLGGSDNTDLINNEVRYNGGFFPGTPENAPEAFGNAGIAVVNGSGSHIGMLGNDVSYNRGPGVAIRYGSEAPSYHWVIQNNTIQNNADDPRGYKGCAFYLHHAHWLWLSGNIMGGHQHGDILDAGDTRHITVHAGPDTTGFVEAVAAASASWAVVNEPITFSAAASQGQNHKALQYRWETDDGACSTQPAFVHHFAEPGLHAAALMVMEGQEADLDFLHMHVLPQGLPLQGEWTVDSDDPDAVWTRDNEQRVAAEPAFSMRSTQGQVHRVRLHLTEPILQQGHLSFWLRFQQEPYVSKEHCGPIVRCGSADGTVRSWRPQFPGLLERQLIQRAAERDGWAYVQLALHTDTTQWITETHSAHGPIQWLEFELGPNQRGYCQAWLDGVQWLQGE